MTWEGDPPPGMHRPGWLRKSYDFANGARPGPDATLTKEAGGYQVTPAMAAGVGCRVWTHRDIAALFD
jgi:hypothetical protein